MVITFLVFRCFYKVVTVYGHEDLVELMVLNLVKSLFKFLPYVFF